MINMRSEAQQNIQGVLTIFSLPSPCSLVICCEALLLTIEAFRIPNLSLSGSARLHIHV